MPGRGASIPVDGCGPGGAQSHDGRLYREAMARNTSPQDHNRDFDRHGGHHEQPEWDEADWDQDQEEEAGHRARRLLSRSSSRIPFGDGFSLFRRVLPSGRWLRRVAVVLGALIVIFVGCFGALWWRLGAGPINLDMATPWLAAAIEDNIGHGNTVEVGGTQIERAGRVRIAVRIRDIIVRDHDHAIVASAPKAEVRLSGAALLTGHLRAESLNLVDAELAIRIAPDGTVTVSAGDTAKPLATGVASKKEAGLPPTFPRNGVPPPPFGTAPATPDASQAAPQPAAQSGILQGLDWLDSLSLTGLDGQNLNEIGLKNGNLIVDDQQRGSKWTFENITLSLRRPSHGGVALSFGEEGARPWSLRATIGPSENGVRSIDIRADKVSTANILLALRVKDLTYTADLPLTGELKGELGRDGVPTFFRGKVTIGAGNIIDTDTPDYPMAIELGRDQRRVGCGTAGAGRTVQDPLRRQSPDAAGPSRAAERHHQRLAARLQRRFDPARRHRQRAAARLQPHRDRLPLRHRSQAHAADAGRHLQRRDRRRRHRCDRLFRRAAPDAGFCGNADVGLRAEADVADAGGARIAPMGDRADRARHAPAHRGRHQFADAQPSAQGTADSR